MAYVKQKTPVNRILQIVKRLYAIESVHNKDLSKEYDLATLLGLFMIFISVAAIWGFVEIIIRWNKEIKQFINKIKSKDTADKKVLKNRVYIKKITDKGLK